MSISRRSNKSLQSPSTKKVRFCKFKTRRVSAVTITVAVSGGLRLPTAVATGADILCFGLIFTAVTRQSTYTGIAAVTVLIAVFRYEYRTPFKVSMLWTKVLPLS